VVVSLEVVEHVYAPRDFAARLFDLVAPGGAAIVSTPYHGYWKNLAIAVSGKFDQHFTALWDHGHIKFWSRDTLARLLREAGFSELAFHYAGRFPPLSKSMIVVAEKPA
jgi:2-polyprenyl-6-hydroxyphenyl methylase/3-demethylubiquinone-9 3-methyltransferase